jgi:hypothetical protein
MGRAVTDLAGVPSSSSLLAGLLAVACAAAPPEPAAPTGAASGRSPASARAVTAPSAGARLLCQALAPRERTRELSARGRAELEASRDGEHIVTARFEPAMALLREAARGGERLAQSVYGRTRFSTLFQGDAPRAEQRELYVEALTFWRTAALAEPEHDGMGLTAATPAALAFPLAELPAAWLQEAWARSDAWIRCHGLPW